MTVSQGKIPKPILAISSSGGHWSQLMLLRDAFDGLPVVYVSTVPNAGEANGLEDYRLVPEANRNSGLRILRLAWSTLRTFAAVNPHTVVSTGALPGLMMVVCGRIAGRRTVWVESIANAEQMSMCGTIARFVCHTCLVQWPEQQGKRTIFAGSVL